MLWNTVQMYAAVSNSQECLKMFRRVHAQKIPWSTFIVESHWMAWFTERASQIEKKQKRSWGLSYFHDHCVVMFIFRRIKNVINQFEVNMDVELQQRGVEFGSLFNKHDSMR